MRRLARRFAFGVLIGVAVSPVPAAAQLLGSYRWQLQPYCHVLTVAVRAQGPVFSFDGYDDPCNAAPRSSVVDRHWVRRPAGDQPYQRIGGRAAHDEMRDPHVSVEVTL